MSKQREGQKILWKTDNHRTTDIPDKTSHTKTLGWARGVDQMKMKEQQISKTP